MKWAVMQTHVVQALYRLGTTDCSVWTQLGLPLPASSATAGARWQHIPEIVMVFPGGPRVFEDVTCTHSWGDLTCAKFSLEAENASSEIIVCQTIAPLCHRVNGCTR
eukprot:462961-Amphidinium_carterae.1